MFMVDKYCWLGPGGNKPFNSLISDWKNNKLSKRSICVLKYIEEHSPIHIDEYDDNIIQYLKDNEVGSNHLNKKHTYAPFLFVNFISNDGERLEITESGIDFLSNVNNGKFEKATEIYLDQLFNANFETDATKDIEIRAFPVQIMFKLLYDKEIIPLFMFQTHIQYINDYSDLIKCFFLLDEDCFFEYIWELEKFYYEDGDKFKSIYKLGTEKWKSYVIGCLLALGIFDKVAYDKGYLKLSDYGKKYVEKKDITNISYEEMFY